MKKLWIFFPEMTLAQFPKSDFFIFRWIFFPKMTLAQFPKNKLFKNHDTVLMKKLWIFFPEMTLAQFPKSEFFENLFFHAKLPEKAVFGYFFQKGRSQTFPNASGFFFQK